MITPDDLKDPDAIQDCKTCHGWGKVNIGSICTGFGGEPSMIDCMCKVYKKIGMDME